MKPKKAMPKKAASTKPLKGGKMVAKSTGKAMYQKQGVK